MGSRLVILVAVAGCGRVGFDASATDADVTPDGTSDGQAAYRVVMEDTFDDGEAIVNVNGIGDGWHTEGSGIGEAAGALNFYEYDADYASSGGVAQDAFTGTTPRRFEWFMTPGGASQNNPTSSEYTFECPVHALVAGNDNFTGEIYYNTTGALYLKLAFELENGRVVVGGRVAASDATKPAACNFACAGLEEVGNFALGDIGAPGATQIHVTLEIDAVGFTYAIDPAPTSLVGAMSSRWTDLGVATGQALAPGVYMSAFGGNEYVGRASSTLDLVRVSERR